MARNIDRPKSIPRPSQVGTQLARTLEALIHNVELRLLRKDNNRAVTRQDLVDLGLVDQSQLDRLED